MPAPDAVAGHRQVVLFLLDGERYALPLDRVERVVRAVEVRSLPEEDPLVLGLINMQGSLLPVLNLRLRLKRPERLVGVDDHFIVAREGEGRFVLPVDTTLGAARFDTVGGLGEGRGSVPPCVSDVSTDEQGMICLLDLRALVTPHRPSAAGPWPEPTDERPEIETAGLTPVAEV